jgi:hypothetical protein
LGGNVIYVGRLSIIGLGCERPHGPLSRSVRLTEGGNPTDREKFGYLAAETELVTEHFGLGLFGLGLDLFGSVFGPRSIMPTPSDNRPRTPTPKKKGAQPPIHRPNPIPPLFSHGGGSARPSFWSPSVFPHAPSLSVPGAAALPRVVRVPARWVSVRC